MEKKFVAVYKIPCSCSKFYIGETRRRLETRMKEHQNACRKGLLKSQPFWNMHGKIETHIYQWEEATVINHARRSGELLAREAHHVQLTPGDECFNKDEDLELPESWMVLVIS